MRHFIVRAKIGTFCIQMRMAKLKGREKMLELGIICEFGYAKSLANNVKKPV